MEILASGGDEYDCAGGQCPTLYRAADGNLYIQGFITDGADVSSVSIPTGEAMVRINKSLLRDLKQAIADGRI